MKTTQRLLSVMIASGLFVLASCGNGGGSADGECTDGATQCSGDIVQHCSGGTWTDYDDCTALGLTCAVLGGEAQCTGGSDTDTDSDVDSDSDADADADGDAGGVTQSGFGCAAPGRAARPGVLSALLLDALV